MKENKITDFIHLSIVTISCCVSSGV